MTDDMQAVHCPECGRMLFKVAGLAHIETKCPKCKALVEWPATNAVVVTPPEIRGREPVIAR